MPLPVDSHPIWKILHALIALAGLVILVSHGTDLDVDAAGAGVVGGVTGARLAWLTFFTKG